MKMYIRATAASMMTCGLGLFAAAAPAAAANEAVDISDGTLLAKGLGFEISNTYTCDPGLTATAAFVDVVQRVKKTELTYAYAPGPNDIECTGNPQTFKVVGQTKPDYLPRKSGVALAILTVNLEDAANTSIPRLELRQEIRLSNK
jgi:hypothetical protein